MEFVPTAIVVAFCIFVAQGHNGYSKSLRKSRSFFVDCCLGRKLLCKSPPVPWGSDRQPRQRLLPSSNVCDGTKDCQMGEDETCVKCGDPPLVTSGFRTDNQTFYPAGAVVAYACQSGFVMRDAQTVTCDGRGSWSKAPVCDKQCVSVTQVPNGIMETTIGPLVVGAVVTFSCAQGYSPMRNNFLRCDSGGSWVGTPMCVRVCPVTSLPSAVGNAIRPAVSDPLTVGTVVTYTCNNGFIPSPDTSMSYTCNENGMWLGGATCVPVCPVSNLLDVGDATRPEVSDPLTVGNVVTYTCNKGFIPSPDTSMSYTCNEFGMWLGSATCVPDTRKVIVCEDAKFTISCPASSVINVESANYGRTQDDSVCPHPDLINPNQNCVSPMGLKVLAFNCDSKSSCTIDVIDEYFADNPCPGTYKYLEMEYTCI